MAPRKISCLPCRIKKVKCDGQKPCERCQIRSLSCVYQKSGAVGRPPKNAVVNKLTLGRIANTGSHNSSTTHVMTNNPFCKEFIFEHAVKAAPKKLTNNNNKDLGLDYYVNNLFFSYFSKQHDRFYSKRYQHLTSLPKFKIFNLTQYFTWMSSDIANVFTRRISKLKLVYYTELDFSTFALRYDYSSVFFETPSHENNLTAAKDSAGINPLASLPPQQAVRLIECFFGIHPYSNLLNKTKLLQAYWTDSANPLLLSVVYGTTIHKSQLLDGKPLELWESLHHNRKKKNPFIDHAYYLLSKESTEATVEKYQAVVLLALFESVFGYPKKGLTLFGLSFLLGAKLGLYNSQLPEGLDPVDQETLLNAYWAAFDSTIRGCVEMEQIPRAGFSYHEHPYPPASIYESKSYQHDMEYNNPVLFKHYFYLVETFYIKAVVARMTSKMLFYLPHRSIPKPLYKAIRRMDGQYVFQHYPKENPKIKEGVAKVLNEFKQFIQENKSRWSSLQTFTFEIFHSFYAICLSFLRDSVVRPTGKEHPFGFHEPQDFTRLDLNDKENVENINQVVLEAMYLLEKCFEHLSDPKNYYGQIDFLPRGIIINAIDAAVQILMYSYELEKSDNVRQYIHLAEVIFSLPNVWSNWNTISAIKKSIQKFLNQHPEEQKQQDDILVEDPDLLSLLPDTSSSSYNFLANPWLTGEEPWIQDINSILFSNDLFENPYILQTTEQQQTLDFDFF